MATRNTGSPIKDEQGNNATKTHLSTHILIKVNGNVVGAVQSIKINERRDVAKIPEVGTDGIIDSAPKSATDVSGSISRTRYNRRRALEALGRGFIHPHAQRIPFDIEIQDIFADNDINNSVITVLENVWITSCDVTYSATDYVIVDDVNWTCERIYSLVNGGNVVNSASSNGLQNPIVLNQFEQEADRGAFTGALDAAGLLNAFLNDPTV